MIGLGSLNRLRNVECKCHWKHCFLTTGFRRTQPIAGKSQKDEKMNAKTDLQFVMCLRLVDTAIVVSLNYFDVKAGK